MNILILGGSRFIGRHLTLQALAAGHKVMLFNRGKSWPEAPVRQLHGDLSELKTFAQAFKDFQPDAVIHCICSTPEQARDFVDTFKPMLCQKVVLSSMDCYAAFQHLVRGEPVNSWPVTEDSPTASEAFYWRETEKDSDTPLHPVDYDKNQVTDLVLSGLNDVTVYRLPMVYGPHDRQYAFRHGPVIQHLLHQQPLYLSEGEQLKIWTFGYVENIAAAILHGLKFSQQKPRPRNIYNLGELQVRPWKQWIQTFYDQAGLTPDIRTLPRDWQSESATVDHFIADSRAFVRDTGFVPPVDFETAVKRTLDYARDHQDQLGPLPDFDLQAGTWDNYLRTLNTCRD